MHESPNNLFVKLVYTVVPQPGTLFIRYTDIRYTNLNSVRKKQTTRTEIDTRPQYHEAPDWHALTGLKIAWFLLCAIFRGACGVTHQSQNARIQASHAFFQSGL